MRREDEFYKPSMGFKPHLSFHDLTDGVLACSGISQAEAVGIVSSYLRKWLKEVEKK